MERFLLDGLKEYLSIQNLLFRLLALNGSNHFQEMVFDTIIQRNVKLSEAPSYGKPVVLYDASSKGAINHMNLAREILQRNAMTKMSKDNVVIN